MTSTTGVHGRAIGIDVGGTGIKGALVDTVNGTLLTERGRIPTPAPATPEAVAATVADVLAKIDAPGPVGITMPSVVRHGIIETASNIDKRWIGTDAVGTFESATGRAVAVVNDADAAGVAEASFGAARGVGGVVLLITLGTGIGSALLYNGVLVPNTELGHLPIRDRAAEDWAAESVREADDLSWKKWAKRLDEYLGYLEALLWPELIIIGGGVSKKSDKFLPHISLRTKLVPAALQNEAGIVGAALSAPPKPE